MLDPLRLPDLPVLKGDRVTLRCPLPRDIDDRLAFPIDPAEEDAYGSEWRRDWDGRTHPTREHLAAAQQPGGPGAYHWSAEYDGRCVGSARLAVNASQHRATYSVGLFVPALRGRGLGREITRLVLDWAFGSLGAHRVQLEVVEGNDRAIRCYRACGFRQEGVRREAELYPDGWRDLIIMGILRAEHAVSQAP